MGKRRIIGRIYGAPDRQIKKSLVLRSMARATIFIFSVFGRPSSPWALPASLCLTQTEGLGVGEGELRVGARGGGGGAGWALGEGSER